MKAKNNVKMIGHLGGAVMKIKRLKKASEGKMTGSLGEKMQHKVTECLVYDGLKARVVDIDRIKEQAQASGTTPYDVIIAERDKQIREL